MKTREARPTYLRELNTSQCSCEITAITDHERRTEWLTLGNLFECFILHSAQIAVTEANKS